MNKSYYQFQIIRRRSTGDYDRGGWVKLIQLRYKETNWTHCYGDIVRHSSEIEYDDYANSERDIAEQETDDSWGSEIISTLPSNLHNTSTSPASQNELERKLEEDFNPGIFGLIENPGVLRLSSVDYPLNVTENNDEENLAIPEENCTLDWIRLSYDDLHLDINTDNAGDQQTLTTMLSRSLDTLLVINS